jgi:hypothetical protein
MKFSAATAVVLCAVNATVLAGADSGRVDAVAARPVTVTGCLQRSEDQAFRLTDPTGPNAPRSRSWKTGFLKKRASDVSVVDPSRRIKLRDHVGHRDALTGTLNDGELRVQSVRHLSASCGH